MRFLLMLPAMASAQFNYTTNSGAITITGYTGPGGAVVIPGTTNGLPVTSIGDFAFFNIANFTDITIPNGVTNIGSYAFYSCSGLTNLVIPGNVASIGQYAFSYCSKLTTVIIPSSVNAIGISAFRVCIKLTSINVENLNSSYSSLDGVLYDKNQTALIQFPAGKAANQFVVPSSVTTIGSFGFDSCAGLTNVLIGDSVTAIGFYAFSFCTSLTSVTIPHGITAIEADTFYFCPSLTNVIIPNGVTYIGTFAFYNCSSLTNITIPSSVTNIDNFAFNQCVRMSAFYFEGNAPTNGTGIFNGDTNSIIYYLPGKSGWGPFFGGRPTALWKPQVQTSDGTFGVRTNKFGFTINWASSLVVVVEICTNLTNPTWSPLQTNTLTGNTFYFSDSDWTNSPSRFYRLRAL